ncbi:ABC transporter substrate-binding protein [Streptomyces sp. N35]|uniref:ABC transporter substrate-binding protein n=1 Tax=Streptomyces sp. N35 TaxID=2795730 RepID=UPI0018F2DBDA|nr:ABC transporter substrate-binding protein [Streptomyces sp. N35]
MPRYGIGVHAERESATGRGAALAVARHNGRADRLFDLDLHVGGDAADPARAKRAARQLVQDKRVVAVLGPASEAAVRAIAATYQVVSMPLLLTTPLAGELDATQRRGLLKLCPDLNTQPSAMTLFLSAVEPVTRTAVVEDRSGGEMSWRFARSLKEFPPSGGSATVHQVAADSGDFTAAATAALTAGAQAVVYAGVSAERAAGPPLSPAVAGSKGPRLAPDPALAGSPAAAGDAADGWTFTATFTDPAELPRAEGFVTAYRERYDVARADRHAVEAYDAVLCLASAMSALGPGRIERGAIVGRVEKATYKGLAKTITISPSTHALDIGSGLFLWRIEKGRERFLGLAKEL